MNDDNRKERGAPPPRDERYAYFRHRERDYRSVSAEEIEEFMKTLEPKREEKP